MGVLFGVLLLNQLKELKLSPLRSGGSLVESMAINSISSISDMVIIVFSFPSGYRILADPSVRSNSATASFIEFKVSCQNWLRVQSGSYHHFR
jgi:hypothetical protein